MPEVFIGEKEFAALLEWTPAQFRATRQAGGIPAPAASYQTRPLWWMDDVAKVLQQIHRIKESAIVDSNPNDF